VDEIASGDAVALAAAIFDVDTTISLSAAGPAASGDLIQIDAEILEVTNALSGGAEYEVARGFGGTTAADHDGSAPVFHLKKRTETASFRRGFFGSSANATWAHHAVLPNARLACSTLELTNALGNSPIGFATFTELAGGGLRSHRGGQLTFQIEGVFGMLENATPILSVQENMSIRDVYAIVKTPPDGSDIELAIRQDGSLVTTLTIPDGLTQSSSISGVSLPHLASGALLTLDIVAVGSLYPGSDLTVTIRV
jgi:hypothetical protein